MSEKPIVHVWITKYAFSEGIIETDAEVCVGVTADMITYKDKGDFSQYVHYKGKDWHTTRESAVKAANIMVDRKIKFLQKQLNKLMATQFV